MEAGRKWFDKKVRDDKIPISLALEIVTGEILYMQDPTHEAEYQLYIMRMAADLLPYERMKQEMIMGD